MWRILKKYKRTLFQQTFLTAIQYKYIHDVGETTDNLERQV